MLCARCVARAPITRTLFAATKRTYADDASPNPPTTALTPGPHKVSAEVNAVRSAVPPGTKLFNINYFKNKADPVALEDGEYPAWLWSSLETSKGAAGESADDAGDLYSKSKKARQLAKKRAAKLAAMAALNPEKKIPIHEQTIDLPFATVTNPAYGPDVVAPLTRTVAATGSVVSKLGKVKVVPSTVAIGNEGDLQVTPDEAAKARMEVRKALRQKGRAMIKEANFLAQM
ncbi:mitochondrial ribosomal protein L37-domain-containing protein [Sphaerosporella brunnea]|uniref:Large ribosomal subunit protein mL54 n=1 Tax=Sphaerosporella brunnea TaxID=1250544 RepID=A0A5J5EGH6_9PEZI|nr:mitochondrial ribosomal protein L37-domain-containing protein [Sphaerosporella brunnea]